jgi:hypothetical protein
MRKRSVQRVGGVAAALASLLSATPLLAQTAEFRLGGGVGIPLGTFNEVVKLGWHGTAGISLLSPTAPFGVRLDGSFARFSAEGAADIQNQLIHGTLGAVYRFLSAPDARLSPYVIGGGGIYHNDAVGDNAPEGSSTDFGVNLGAGFEFDAGGAGLFLEGRWHNVFLEGDNLKFLPITLGIRFGGP